ncbi:MAG: hypothetical protein IPN17_22800 [Deltaproteobacteria bacterium]|nr:hypothetical protein [Deltaproteobacteria bacterium]
MSTVTEMQRSALRPRAWVWLAALSSACDDGASTPWDATVDIARDALPRTDALVDAPRRDEAVIDGARPSTRPTRSTRARARGPWSSGRGETASRLSLARGRVELVMGPQGGWHVYGRVRLAGITPDVYLTFALIPEGGGAPVNFANETVRRQERRGLTAVGDLYESSYGELVILADGVRPPDVVGRRFRFGVRIERPDATMVRVLVGSDERAVTVIDEVP